MPRYKYVANRVADARPEHADRAPSSPSTTPATARSRAQVLETLPLEENSDDFVFDNQMLAQIVCVRLLDRRGELPDEVFPGGVQHLLYSLGPLWLGVLWCCLKFRLQKWGLRSYRIFDPNGRKIEIDPSRPPSPGPAVSESQA